MNRIPIVTSAVALLLNTGQPVESPTISTPSAVDDYSMLADPDNSESGVSATQIRVGVACVAS